MLEDQDYRQRILFVCAAAALVFFVSLAGYFLFRWMAEERAAVPDDGRTYSHIPDTEERCAALNKTEQQKCFDRIKTAAAVSGLDAEKCIGIKTVSMRNDCLYSVAVDLKDAGLCSRIADPETKEGCISSVSIATKDIKTCEDSREEPYEYRECKDRVTAFIIAESGEKNDIAECGAIKTLEYANLCVNYSLKNKFNFQCAIVPTEYRDYCFAQNIIVSEPAETDCSKIETEAYKKFCLRVAREGLYNAQNIDTDGDGLDDGKELFMKTDPENPDTDGDGVSDGEEMARRTDPVNPDTDGDGITDPEEMKLGTDPNNPDTDGDGMNDGTEMDLKEDPVSGDKDKDGLSDIFERRIGTDPNNPDTDGDGMSDKYEWDRGFDPLKKGAELSDTDGDGISDIDEVFYETDRLAPDKLKKVFIKDR